MKDELELLEQDLIIVEKKENQTNDKIPPSVKDLVSNLRQKKALDESGLFLQEEASLRKSSSQKKAPLGQFLPLTKGLRSKEKQNY